MTSGQDRIRRSGPRRPPSRYAAAGAVLATIAVLAGCGANAGYGAPVAPKTMSVSSVAFSQNVMPQRYTCHGAGINPPLDWSGAPSGTKSFALVVDDSSAPITPDIYWLVFDIGPGTTDIQEGSLPTGARQALNSANKAGYTPPCPSQPHWYRFTVYALNTVLNLPEGAPLLTVWTAIAAADIGRGRIPVMADP